ncbi:MAG: hypothetical protein ACXWM6_11055 [Thermodesulfobacteriota bacterium]
MILKKAFSTFIIFSFMAGSLAGGATYKPDPLSPSQTASSIQNRTLDSWGGISTCLLWSCSITTLIWMTSTLLNLIVLPILALRYSRFEKKDEAL